MLLAKRPAHKIYAIPYFVDKKDNEIYLVLPVFKELVRKNGKLEHFGFTISLFGGSCERGSEKECLRKELCEETRNILTLDEKTNLEDYLFYEDEYIEEYDEFKAGRKTFRKVYVLPIISEDNLDEFIVKQNAANSSYSSMYSSS